MSIEGRPDFVRFLPVRGSRGGPACHLRRQRRQQPPPDSSDSDSNGIIPQRVEEIDLTGDSPPVSPAYAAFHSPPVSPAYAAFHSPPVSPAYAAFHSPPASPRHSPPAIPAYAAFHSPPVSPGHSPPASPAYAAFHSPPAIPAAAGPGHMSPVYHPTGRPVSPPPPAAASPASSDSESSRGGASKCVACWHSAPSVLIMPCRHLSMCGACAEKANFARDGCPMCRGPVESTVGPVFLP